MFNQILISLMLLRMGYLMVLPLFSAVSYIFERHAYQLCFQIPFYVFLGMWIISRDSHIYMQRFVLHLHHVILTSSYTEGNERLLYEIHFYDDHIHGLGKRAISFCRLPLALVSRNLDKTLLKCCHVYIFYHSI